MTWFRRFRAKPTPPPATENTVDLNEIDKQIKRLSKELYKSNTLIESQTGQTRQTVEALQSALNRLAEERTSNLSQARVSVIKTLLPVIDSIEAGLQSGLVQAATVEASSPDAALILHGWLDGQRLLLDRLLGLLANEEVLSIPTHGLLFDPHKHIAVKTVVDPSQPAGTIVAQERRGFSYRNELIRYADVVVNKPESNGAEKQP